jgi:hypothetical protein
MIRSGQALREISSPDLKDLLRAVHRGELSCPITREGLATINMLSLGDELGHLRGLDPRAVQAVLVAVLAERR